MSTPFCAQSSHKQANIALAPQNPQEERHSSLHMEKGIHQDQETEDRLRVQNTFERPMYLLPVFLLQDSPTSIMCSWNPSVIRKCLEKVYSRLPTGFGMAWLLHVTKLAACTMRGSAHLQSHFLHAPEGALSALPSPQESAVAGICVSPLPCFPLLQLLQTSLWASRAPQHTTSLQIASISL